MMGIGLGLLALAIQATAQAQPAPRVTLDAELRAADGFTFDRHTDRGRLAVASNGMHHVLLHQAKGGREPLATASDARVDLVSVTPDGKVTLRKALPIREKLGLSGFSIASLGIVVARSGDLAVFWSPNEEGHETRPGRSFGTLLRLGTDGGVRKATAIAAPTRASARQDPAAYYEIGAWQATPDNGVLLGGGFGSGPYAWWMGKFSLDGVRLWQAGPGGGFPEQVAAIGPRANGSWLSLVAESTPGGGLHWFIRHNAADGTLLARRRLSLPVGNAAAVLRNGVALVSYVDDRAQRLELIFVDDAGTIRRRAPWAFGTPYMLQADSGGLAAVVAVSTDANETRTCVVRIDGEGTVRWRSAEVDVADLAPTPDGQIAVLLRSDKDDRLRLVRYADP